MGFRTYDPTLNQFLSRDMYNGALSDVALDTDPFTGNRYTFGAGNPVSNIELDGHRPADCTGECMINWEKAQAAAAHNLSQASASTGIPWDVYNAEHQAALFAALDPIVTQLLKEGYTAKQILSGLTIEGQNYIPNASKDNPGIYGGYPDIIFRGRGGALVWEVKKYTYGPVASQEAAAYAAWLTAHGEPAIPGFALSGMLWAWLLGSFSMSTRIRRIPQVAASCTGTCQGRHWSPTPAPRRKRPRTGFRSPARPPHWPPSSELGRGWRGSSGGLSGRTRCPSGNRAAACAGLGWMRCL